MKAIYQWTLHGLVVKVLFHCASPVVNDLQMQQWFQQIDTTLNYK
jgi:hypothetical protein